MDTPSKPCGATKTLTLGDYAEVVLTCARPKHDTEYKHYTIDSPEPTVTIQYWWS